MSGFEVHDQKPSDSDLLIPSIETHQKRIGRTPDLAAADAGFYSAKNAAKAEEMGVKRVSVPNRSTKSPARRQYQKQRWFKNGQKWRTGCEGRISLLKRRHGLRRLLYKKDTGMKRWGGLGVIADNLINLGRAMAKQRTQSVRFFLRPRRPPGVFVSSEALRLTRSRRIPIKPIFAPESN